MFKYLRKSAILGLITGLLCFFISIFILKIFYALLFSLSFTLLLIIVLPFVLFLEDKKYKDINLQITEDILLKENVNLKLEKNVQNGYIIITKNKIYLFFRSKKSYIEVIIQKENIKAVFTDGKANFMIETEETSYHFASGKNRLIIETLKANSLVGEKNA